MRDPGRLAFVNYVVGSRNIPKKQQKQNKGFTRNRKEQSFSKNIKKLLSNSEITNEKIKDVKQNKE